MLRLTFWLLPVRPAVTPSSIRDAVRRNARVLVPRHGFPILGVIGPVAFDIDVRDDNASRTGKPDFVADHFDPIAGHENHPPHVRGRDGFLLLGRSGENGEPVHKDGRFRSVAIVALALELLECGLVRLVGWRRLRGSRIRRGGEHKQATQHSHRAGREPARNDTHDDAPSDWLKLTPQGCGGNDRQPSVHQAGGGDLAPV